MFASSQRRTNAVADNDDDDNDDNGDAPLVARWTRTARLTANGRLPSAIGDRLTQTMYDDSRKALTYKHSRISIEKYDTMSRYLRRFATTMLYTNK